MHYHVLKVVRNMPWPDDLRGCTDDELVEHVIGLYNEGRLEFIYARFRPMAGLANAGFFGLGRPSKEELPARRRAREPRLPLEYFLQALGKVFDVDETYRVLPG